MDRHHKSKHPEPGLPNLSCPGPARHGPAAGAPTQRTPAAGQGSFTMLSAGRRDSVLAADADEDRAGAYVDAVERGGSAVPAAVDGHAVADVNSDVGHAHAAVLVVGEVARLSLSGAHGAAEGQVACRPAVVVDAHCGQRVGRQHGAVLGDADLRVGSCGDRSAHAADSNRSLRGQGSRHGGAGGSSSFLDLDDRLGCLDRGRCGGDSRLLVGDRDAGGRGDRGRCGGLYFRSGSRSRFALNVGLGSVGCDTAGQYQAGGSSDNRSLATHTTGVVADGLSNDSQRVGLGDLRAVACNGCTSSHLVLSFVILLSARLTGGTEDAPASWGYAGSPRNGFLSEGCTAKTRQKRELRLLIQSGRRQGQRGAWSSAGSSEPRWRENAQHCGVKTRK